MHANCLNLQEPSSRAYASCHRAPKSIATSATTCVISLVEEGPIRSLLHLIIRTNNSFGWGLLNNIILNNNRFSKSFTFWLSIHMILYSYSMRVLYLSAERQTWIGSRRRTRVRRSSSCSSSTTWRARALASGAIRLQESSSVTTAYLQTLRFPVLSDPISARSRVAARWQASVRELFHLLTAGRLSPSLSPSPGRSPASGDKPTVRFAESAPNGRRAFHSSRPANRNAISAPTTTELSESPAIDSDNEQLSGLSVHLQRYAYLN